MSKSTKKSTGSSGSSGSSSSKTSSSSSSKKPVELIVRPSNVNPVNVSKAYVSLETLRESGLEGGSFIQFGSQGLVIPIHPQPIDQDTIQLSLSSLLVANMFPGDRLQLQKASKPPVAAKVVVQKSDNQDSDGVKELVKSVGLVYLGQWLTESLKVVEVAKSLEDKLATLTIDNVSQAQQLTYLVESSTVIEVISDGKSRESEFSLIGGLDKELDLVKSQTELPLKYPAYFSRFNTDPERGILLYGPPGTGKTMLLKAVARETENAHVLRVNGPSIFSKYQGETEAKLRAIFDEAERFAPSIIFIDEIDALAPKRDSDDSGETESRVVATLLTLMDGMRPGGRVVIIGATNRPNQLDPALRRPGRLGNEIEVGIPDSRGRRQILELMLSNMPHHLTNEDIGTIADKSHGYVGADLQALVREAVVNVVRQCIQSDREIKTMFIERVDLDGALVSVRPSAMREIALELPKVHWADIGGQVNTIQRLRETVEWPLQKADAFERLGISPPRGVLLYGPPGCSKTLLAKALATEAGLNFLAVKGPELFNKYVGESERAIREVFRKARQAAPSIIFFDEIDALSVSRGEGEAGGDRVLTSLLNEMDGIEALNEVVVLAATNRPDVIDSALMRPGRLDRLIYVNPPDLDARRQILLIQFSKMAIDESVDLDKLALQTEGFSGAEIVNICQEAGLLAMNDDPEVTLIEEKYFEAAVQGVRKTITPEMISYFENFAGTR